MAREVHGWRFMFNYTVTDVRHTVPELRQTDFDVGHTIADDLFVRVKSFELRRISGTASRRYTILRSLRIGKSSGFPRTSRPFTSILPSRHDGRRASERLALLETIPVGGCFDLLSFPHNTREEPELSRVYRLAQSATVGESFSVGSANLPTPL